MGPIVALYLLIALVVGMVVGWNARTARGANADLKVHRARIPNFKRVRARTGLLSLALLVLTLLAVHDLIR